jgi:uncharacterized membrane protein YcaP (DUF421 family)
VPVFDWMLRTVFIYFYMLFVMRVMGKREIGKLSVFDLVVSVMMAELSALALESRQYFGTGVFMITMLGLLQIVVSWAALKCETVRRVVEGSPVTLVVQGRIDDEQMRKTRYSIDDLMVQLREKGITDVADVEWAVLEPTGKLSVIPKAEARPLTPKDVHASVSETRIPVPVIADGKILPENLQHLGLNPDWLLGELRKQGIENPAAVFLATVDASGRLYIDRLEHR